MLRVQGSRIVDPSGRPVLLRGFGLGGWMNMENFITGFPAYEEALREALLRVLGPEKQAFFFDRFLEHFFTAADAAYIRSLRLNLVRLPVNYRHFEDDDRPFEIKEAGFKHLDRVIRLCADQGIYTILDLHALPGYQNMHWHSDNPTHKALFWRHRHFQDRAVHLWEAFARRYKGHPWVAGYNLINEPADGGGERFVPVCKRLLDAVRAVDPDHIVFLDGNRYSVEFQQFGEPWPNVVYTNHDYAAPGFIDGGPYPGETKGRHVDKAALEKAFLAKSEYMLRTKTPIWVGEFGPVYKGEPRADAMRIQLAKDQIGISSRHEASWALWTYKDVGLQGVVQAAPDSPWMRRIRPVLEKKARLGADSWGGTDARIRDVMEPLERLFAREFPAYQPYPFGAVQQIQVLVRNILIAEPLVDEFAALFQGVPSGEIDALMASFRFEHCVRREPLARLLSESAKGGSVAG